LSIDYTKIAQKHNISLSAVQHLANAIALGNGIQAQFNHPELGGMGQWMPTMMMIGDAFNYTLKAKVDVLCHELATAYHNGDLESTKPPTTMNNATWWSNNDTKPTFSGTQNNIRYAYFKSQNQLRIHHDGFETTYNTRPYILTGVSQQQDNDIQSIAFHTQDGKHLTIKDFEPINS